MTMTAGSGVFLDANILVYASFDHVPWHILAKQRLIRLGQARSRFWTSRQVLREFLTVTSRPGFLVPTPPAPFPRSLVEDFESRFRVAEDERYSSNSSKTRERGAVKSTMPTSWPPCGVTASRTC